MTWFNISVWSTFFRREMTRQEIGRLNSPERKSPQFEQRASQHSSRCETEPGHSGKTDVYVRVHIRLYLSSSLYTMVDKFNTATMEEVKFNFLWQII